MAGDFQGAIEFDPYNPLAVATASGPYTDIMIAKYDSSGVFLWAQSTGGYEYEFGYSLAHSGDGFYVVGSYYGNTDFDPSNNFYEICSVGGRDLYIMKLHQDVIAPNAISIATTFTGPADLENIEFTVEFDDDVVNFDSEADLVFSHVGTSSVGVQISGGPRLYSVLVEGISGDGTFTLAVDIGSDVQDLAGNALGSSVTSAPVFIDGSLPGLPLQVWPGFLMLTCLGAWAVRRHPQQHRF